jgi:hypothetical protein
MDCNTSRLFLLFADRARDALSPQDAAALNHHLAACADCQHTADTQKQTDERLAQSMQAVPIPLGLRERLAVRLAEERRKRNRRRALRYLAYAACLLLAVGLGIWSLQPPLTVVDFNDVANQLGDMPDTALKAEQALSASSGQPVQVPLDFNYALLVHCGPAQFQHRTVPTLDFQTANFQTHTTFYARVYVLRDTQFDLKPLLGHSPLPNAGRYNVEVRWSVDGHYAYLVIFTGDTLDPFLQQGLPPA